MSMRPLRVKRCVCLSLQYSPPLTRAAERRRRQPSKKAKHLREALVKVEYLYRVAGVHETPLHAAGRTLKAWIL